MCAVRASAGARRLAAVRSHFQVRRSTRTTPYMYHGSLTSHLVFPQAMPHVITLCLEYPLNKVGHTCLVNIPPPEQRNTAHAGLLSALRVHEPRQTARALIITHLPAGPPPCVPTPCSDADTDMPLSMIGAPPAASAQPAVRPRGDVA